MTKKIAILLLLATCIIQVSAQKMYPDSIVKKRMWIAAGSQTAFYLGGMSFLQWVWYKDHKAVPFHFYNDSRGYLQMDKCGHAFSAYKESNMSYNLFRWAGMSRKKALWLGGPMGLILQTPIEVFDGLYEGYGFSKSDMLANSIGSALFTAQQIAWDRQVIRPKFSYAPSPYRQYHPYLLGETQLESFFLDYNGHTYWLSASLRDITGIKKIPAWLCISAGYSANGMIGEFENKTSYRGTPIPAFERYRQYLFSVDVDLTKVKTKSAFLRALMNAAGTIKFPAPTIEFNRPDGVKLHGLYF